MSKPKSELTKRVVSALILTGVGLYMILVAPEQVFCLFLFFLALVGLYEYATALEQRIKVDSVWHYIVGFVFLMAGWLWLNRSLMGALILLVLSLALLLALTLLGGQGRVQRFFALGGGLLWVIFPFLSACAIRLGFEGGFGARALVFMLLVGAFNDIAAYFGGKRFGKRPLAKAISPNKTIEGSLFGLLGGLCLAFVSGRLMMPEFSDFQALMIALVMIPLAQTGDLIESKFKRFCGIKDSGNILPGHGGILDRFDAYLLVLPIFWLILITL